MLKNGRDEGWMEIGRYDTGWRAFNKMIETQMRALGNTVGRVEIMSSRSRPGKVSFAVFTKYTDGPKLPLEYWESQYVEGLQKNRARSRRTSRRASRRTSRRTSRR